MYGCMVWFGLASGCMVWFGLASGCMQSLTRLLRRDRHAVIWIFVESSHHMSVQRSIGSECSIYIASYVGLARQQAIIGFGDVSSLGGLHRVTDGHRRARGGRYHAVPDGRRVMVGMGRTAQHGR